MNTLIRWDPFKEMEDLQSRLTKLFGLTPARTENGGRELMTITEWAPSVDIIEDEKEWLVKADLPEVKKEEVRVTVENGVLCALCWRLLPVAFVARSGRGVSRKLGQGRRTVAATPRWIAGSDSE